MPEIRINPSRQPHSTGIPNAKPANNPNSGPTLGAHISASPSAGHIGQQQVQAARAAYAGAPTTNPPSGQASPAPVKAQSAAVMLNHQPRRNVGVIRAGSGGGGSTVGAYQNSKPTVELIQRAATPQPTRVSQSPFTMDEILLIGNLLHAAQSTANPNETKETIDHRQGLVNNILHKLADMMDQIPAPAVSAPPSPMPMPQAMPSVIPPGYATPQAEFGPGFPPGFNPYGVSPNTQQPYDYPYPQPSPQNTGGQMFGATIIGEAPSVQVVATPANAPAPTPAAPKAE